jgi:hypothetical protein
VAVVHRLQEEDPPFARLVLIGAVERGRAPGALAAYRWDRFLPDGQVVQERVAEAVTGVISLENLAIVVAALGAAPPEVYLVEVEPEVEALGSELGAAVAGAADEAERLVREIVFAPPADALVPEAPLGGWTSTNGHPRTPLRSLPYDGCR